MSLTDLQIRKMKAPEKGQKTHFDDALPGFGVRISQGGSKTFIVLCGKERKRRTLGRYPDLSLSDARIKAKQAQLAHLQDTGAAQVEAIGFSEARDAFLRDAERRNKPRTVEEYHRLLYRHFSFRSHIGDLTRRDITKAIDKFAATPSEQKHAFVALRTMLNWCVKRGWLDVSPVPPLTFAAAARNRVLSDTELKAIWHQAEAIGFPYGRIVQLLILTGQRRGEIAGLRWDWIGEDAVTFPPGFVKNKREHTVPLGPMAMAVLEGLPESNGLLFPARGRDDAPFSGWSKSKRMFDNTIDVTDYTLHDLRRTYSSTMARLGTPIHVTEKLLNHVSGTISGVAAIYNRHSYQSEMREAVLAYEADLLGVVGG